MFKHMEHRSSIFSDPDANGVVLIRDLCGGYGQDWIISSINLSVKGQETVAIAGPNGSGKSSLVRGICNMLPVQKGEIFVEGTEFQKLGRRGFARLVAVVPQHFVLDSQFTVEEFVMLGRIPHVPRFKPYSVNDYEVVTWAIEQVGMQELLYREVSTLSGGERQRAAIAQALAQDPHVLILDEPTAFLDLNHQIEIMELLQKLSQNYHMTIILTSHDLNLAAMYCNRLIIMKKGKFVADGKPSTVLSCELLKEVYGIDALLVTHPDENVPHILLRKKHRDSDLKSDL